VMGRMARVFQIDPEDFLEVYSQSRGAYDQGLETPEEYWLRFAREAGVRINAERIEELRKWDTRMWSRINHEMKDWLGALHEAGFTTALLSNMQLDMAEYSRRSFPWLAHFDHLIFSYEVRLIKPDPAIYRHALQQIGIKAKEAIFVDDRQANVDAAKAMGLRAIRFQSVEQLRAELEKTGFEILPKRAEMKSR
jgi:putative hydrolase of the HAD superfamily